MGRVYEALRRAAERQNEAEPVAPNAGHVAADVTVAPSADGVPDADLLGVEVDRMVRESTVLRSSPIVPDGLPLGSTVRHDSASNEQFDARVGSALPGAGVSRAAGATLDADSSARAWQFPTLEIDPARVEPHLVSITTPRAAFAERFRSLRTRVLRAGEKENVQTIVITSSGVMEGKTVTALNLAWQLAQAEGVRALLIDGDLRHPCAAEYLGLEAPAGLSEVLAGSASLVDSIVRLEPAGLHLLPGGAARDDVADLLSGPTFASVLAEAREMFDFIILDAPPLGIFTDAAVLMNRADAALLVIRAGRVKFTQLDRLLEGVPQERILGVVLNGSDEQLDESNYYYYRNGRNRNRHSLGSGDKDERAGVALREEEVQVS